MKILSLIVILLALPSFLKAAEAHLTKVQVKQIAKLVAKGLEPEEPLFDEKSGTWICSVGPSGPSFGRIIRIRDKDGYYQILDMGGQSKDFKMATSLKRRISKILKSNDKPADADQPATKPADKSPLKHQPSTSTSKEGPR